MMISVSKFITTGTPRAVYKQPNWQNYSNNRANAANYFNGPAPIRRCFNCGSPTHFRNNCPLLASKNDVHGNVRSIHLPIAKSNAYPVGKIEIIGEVNSIKTPLIIDTGASITVVDRKTIVSGEVTPIDVNFKLETANGAYLKLLGNAVVLIKLGEIELAHNCLVADKVIFKLGDRNRLEQTNLCHMSPVTFLNQKENENIINLAKEKIQGLISKVGVAAEVPADGDCGAHVVKYKYAECKIEYRECLL
ncbi:Uncharacterized protein FWK35_00024654 [Aphis craccivora]|uniref:CCHC-type domain-containing protein n=1 Tax=Aphis craccivora TaxID=307492 RepID=A0A6G0WLT2_APHCR|nr:Uncharacterized protein FWK35_00024654 [Aphis craccivora]